MRDFRDAKAMARALRDALKAKAIETTHAEALELIAKAFGYENWNILSAKIEASEPLVGNERAISAATQDDKVSCSFCRKSQHEVRKLIAGPSAFICDECVDLCTEIVEPDDDKELFRVMTGAEESGRLAYPALLELARGISTEELAYCMERGKKGVERNRSALQYFQRRLAVWDAEAQADDDLSTPPRHLAPPRELQDATREKLVAMQQKAQRALKRYEDALNIATSVLGERRQ